MNILTFDNFFPDTVAHGFFGRRGGVSAGLYDSLNCSFQSKDNPDAISENRVRVLKALGGKELSTLKQIHSPLCFSVENTCMSGIEEGDALVTCTPGHVIGCLTADCGPVLFSGFDVHGAPVIGAAHAGWGGALKGVIEATVKGMIDLGVEISSIKAAIGPCIGEASYEVGETFLKPFYDEDKRAGGYFSAGKDGKFQFDLQGYIEFRLRRAGVSHIIKADRDTYALKERYFSYRRATHSNETDYGRQISAICIRSY